MSERVNRKRRVYPVLVRMPYRDGDVDERWEVHAVFATMLGARCYAAANGDEYRTPDFPITFYDDEVSE